MTKKNHSRIVTNPKTKRAMLIPSKPYMDYKKKAAWFIPKLSEPISEPVNVKYTFYMPTRRKVDMTNLQAAMDDILTERGIFEDDNRDYVAAHDGTRVYWDSENPRAEITITPLPDDDYVQWSTMLKRR